MLMQDIFSKCKKTADLVTFAEEMLNAKLYYLCNEGHFLPENEAYEK